MLDKVTVVPRKYADLGDAAQDVVKSSILRTDVIEKDTFASIDVIPKGDRHSPHRPFLHRGDWLDDGQGTLWTVLTALLHEDDDDSGEPYLWHEYEVIGGMLRV